ncbi:MAG: protease SohB [Gammaproteobacteria bacterium]|nr:MAG: protease SohB [Gammaproteobacteria bacterium]
MAAFVAEYGLFLLKALTILIVLLVGFLGILAIASRGRQAHAGPSELGYIEITDLSALHHEREHAVRELLEPPKQFKHWAKQQEKARKSREKEFAKHPQKVIYVIDFNGDIQASGVRSLREEISAILAVANPTDEILVRLESTGGVVHGYGLAASQLQRIRDRGIPLTIAIDKVAASGGYMMACMGTQVLSAPFAIIGSIGVIGQVPNINKLLKKHDVDIEMHTAGAYKRTLTVLGENTEEARKKFIEDLDQTHQLFKQLVGRMRPDVDIDKVSTGEIWFGQEAIALKLVDTVMTSDEYLQSRVSEARLVRVAHKFRKNLAQKAGFGLENALDRTVMRWLGRFQHGRFLP